MFPKAKLKTRLMSKYIDLKVGKISIFISLCYSITKLKLAKNKWKNTKKLKRCHVSNEDVGEAAHSLNSVEEDNYNVEVVQISAV